MIRKLLLGIALIAMAAPAFARHGHSHQHRPHYNHYYAPPQQVYSYPRTYIPAVRPHWNDDRSYYDNRYDNHRYQSNRYLCDGRVIYGRIYAQTRYGYIVIGGNNRYDNCFTY